MKHTKETGRGIGEATGRRLDLNCKIFNLKLKRKRKKYILISLMTKFLFGSADKILSHVPVIIVVSQREREQELGGEKGIWMIKMREEDFIGAKILKSSPNKNWSITNIRTLIL